jgi:hypothetical protein
MTAPTLELKSSFISHKQRHNTNKTWSKDSGSCSTRWLATGSKHEAATERTSSSRSPRLSFERKIILEMIDDAETNEAYAPQNCRVNNSSKNNLAVILKISVFLVDRTLIKYVTPHSNLIFDSEQTRVPDLPKMILPSRGLEYLVVCRN